MYLKSAPTLETHDTHTHTHDPKADCVKSFESKGKWKTKTKPGERIWSSKTFVSAQLRSRDFRVTRVMLLMRRVTLFPYFFPSFLPRLLSSLQGSSVRSFEGEGRNVTSARNGYGLQTCGKIQLYYCGKQQYTDFISRFSQGIFLYLLVEEEETCSMRGGHILWHVADFKVVDETPEEQQETCGGKGRFTAQNLSKIMQD